MDEKPQLSDATLEPTLVADMTDDELEMMASEPEELGVVPFAEYILTCDGTPHYVTQIGIRVPRNCFIQLFDSAGEMDAGPAFGGRKVDCRGYHNGQILDPGTNCLDPRLNKLCFIVRIGALQSFGTTLRWSIHSPRGASVGDRSVKWSIGNNEGGDCQVAFNDDDANNSGRFQQTMRVYTRREFARRVLEERRAGTQAPPA